MAASATVQCSQISPGVADMAPRLKAKEQGQNMHLSDEGLIVILVVGFIAGWLAGKVVRGDGFGLVGDAAIGIVGALIGDGFCIASGFISVRASSGSSGINSFGARVILRRVGSIDPFGSRSDPRPSPRSTRTKSRRESDHRGLSMPSFIAIASAVLKPMPRISRANR